MVAHAIAPPKVFFLPNLRVKNGTHNIPTILKACPKTR